MTDERPAADRRDGTERRSATPGPVPGGVERRRQDDRRAQPRAPRRDDLAGTGHTGLSRDAALRARDVDRPDDDDLARAEADLTIVRRHWTPPPLA